MGADAKRKEARRRKFGIGPTSNTEQAVAESFQNELHQPTVVSDNTSPDVIHSSCRDGPVDVGDELKGGVQQSGSRRSQRFIAFIGQFMLCTESHQIGQDSLIVR